MPLPFAPPPGQSKVYRDLGTIKIDDLTPDQFDTLKGAVYAQGIDGAEDEYRRLLLLGSVSNKASISGPIPGSGKIDSAATTSSGSAVTLVDNPGDGEVWQLMGVSSSNAAGVSGNLVSSIRVNDSSNVVNLAKIEDNNGYKEIPLQEPIYIDKNVKVEAVTAGTFSSVTYTAYLMRVR
jgi:hypothetical protein